MQQLQWYYRIGLFLLALVLVACGDDNADSEANIESINNDAPANASDTASNDTFSVPDNGDVVDYGLGNDTIAIDPQTVRVGEGTLLINVTMPEGYKFNDLAPFRGDFESDGVSVAVANEWLHYEELMPTMPLEVPVTFSEGQATVTADLHIYWCEAINETLCFVDNHVLTIPITVDTSTDASVADAVIALVPPE